MGRIHNFSLLFHYKRLIEGIIGNVQRKTVAHFSWSGRQTGGFGACELTCYSWNVHSPKELGGLGIVQSGLF